MQTSTVVSEIISNSRSVIVEQLTESCVELFESYDTKVEIDESGESTKNDSCDQVSIIGLLGASANGLRTTIAIQMNYRILQDTFPADLNNEMEQKLQDWVGELSNQLIGRLKNKLLPYGAELTLGVPAVIQGSQLKTILPRRTEISTHRFITNQDDVILLVLSTLIEDEFFLHLPDTENEVMAEGELLFF